MPYANVILSYLSILLKPLKLTAMDNYRGGGTNITLYGAICHFLIMPKENWVNPREGILK